MNKPLKVSVHSHMSTPQIDRSSRKPLRLWPGITLVLIQWFAWFVIRLIFPKYAIFGVFAGVICGLLVLIWWIFFSRALWLERIGAVVLMVVAVAATKFVVHP